MQAHSERKKKKRRLKKDMEDLVESDLTVLHYRVSRVKAVWHWWEARPVYRVRRVNPGNGVTVEKQAPRETRARQVDSQEPFLCEKVQQKDGWQWIPFPRSTRYRPANRFLSVFSLRSNGSSVAGIRAGLFHAFKKPPSFLTGSTEPSLPQFQLSWKHLNWKSQSMVSPVVRLSCRN